VPGRGTPSLGPAGETPHAVPIYQTSNFVYPDADAADRAAAGGAYFYGRHGNPTNEALERAVADLEGAEAGLSFASGMAAIAAALFASVERGEVVASEGIYGGTTELLRDQGPRHGLTVRFVPAWDTEAVKAAIGPSTRALLVETLTNPLLRVPDLAALGALARERGLPLLVDSTFASPILCRPLEHGASLVVHSVSKYIGGHGDLIGGVVVGPEKTLAAVKRQRTLLGGAMDPFCAFLAVRGLRTLAVRMERQCATAAHLAQVLGGLPAVKRVHYPGRTDHPDHGRADRLLAAPGGMVSFEVADGAAARKVYDRVQVVARAASLGEVASLLTHPASFSHKGLGAEERVRLGIPDGLLRLSVGLEDPADLEEDLRQAVGAA
jgi:cystathionine beta-lyase/cystathionine gamma-synthase